ncbi:hypothetical protein BDZ88DRAFT_275153 [Geranomyces variabilis]|nr:hypothetical protein BDZ88DRAFT_275153 [Geranomyces variabilis]
MDPHLAVKLNYTFTAVALAIQACNAAYCLQHALDRRTAFNSVLCACMIVYMASFIPLIFTSRMAVELSFLQDSPTSPFHAEFKKQQTIIQIWTALYGLGTFPYVILVQIRFRVVKAVFKYHKNWDHFFVGFTSAVWLATIAVCGVIYPPSVQVQGLATTAWTIYALLCENLLSFIFISQLFHVRRQLNSGIEARFQKVRRSLFFLCSMTWIGLALSLIAWTYYANDGMLRTLFFRASMTFSPLAYSGALVRLMQSEAAISNSTNTGCPLPSGLHLHRSYIVPTETSHEPVRYQRIENCPWEKCSNPAIRRELDRQSVNSDIAGSLADADVQRARRLGNKRYGAGGIAVRSSGCTILRRRESGP